MSKHIEDIGEDTKKLRQRTKTQENNRHPTIKTRAMVLKCKNVKNSYEQSNLKITSCITIQKIIFTWATKKHSFTTSNNTTSSPRKTFLIMCLLHSISRRELKIQSIKDLLRFIIAGNRLSRKRKRQRKKKGIYRKEKLEIYGL